jgi:hypothetical protein
MKKKFSSRTAARETAKQLLETKADFFNCANFQGGGG